LDRYDFFHIQHASFLYFLDLLKFYHAGPNPVKVFLDLAHTFLKVGVWGNGGRLYRPPLPCFFFSLALGGQRVGIVIIWIFESLGISLGSFYFRE
jgi:hypothetical protein